MNLELTPAEAVTLEMVLSSYRHRCADQLRNGALESSVRTAIAQEEVHAFSLLAKMAAAR